MDLVVDNLEVFKLIIENRVRAAFYFKRGQWKRVARKLRVGLLEVITVKVYVAAAPHEISGFEVALLRDHRG